MNIEVMGNYLNTTIGTSSYSKESEQVQTILTMKWKVLDEWIDILDYSIDRVGDKPSERGCEGGWGRGFWVGWISIYKGSLHYYKCNEIGILAWYFLLPKYLGSHIVIETPTLLKSSHSLSPSWRITHEGKQTSLTLNCKKTKV